MTVIRSSLNASFVGGTTDLSRQHVRVVGHSKWPQAAFGSLRATPKCCRRSSSGAPELRMDFGRRPRTRLSLCASGPIHGFHRKGGSPDQQAISEIARRSQRLQQRPQGAAMAPHGAAGLSRLQHSPPGRSGEAVMPYGISPL